MLQTNYIIFKISSQIAKLRDENTLDENAFDENTLDENICYENYTFCTKNCFVQFVKIKYEEKSSQKCQ